MSYINTQIEESLLNYRLLHLLESQGWELERSFFKVAHSWEMKVFLRGEVELNSLEDWVRHFKLGEESVSVLAEGVWLGYGEGTHIENYLDTYSLEIPLNFAVAHHTHIKNKQGDKFGIAEVFNPHKTIFVTVYKYTSVWVNHWGNPVYTEVAWEAAYSLPSKGFEVDLYDSCRETIASPVWWVYMFEDFNLAVEPPPDAVWPISRSCGEMISYSAEDVAHTEVSVVMGAVAGHVTLNYYTYGVSECFEVYYRGDLIATTGGMVSGSGTLGFYYEPRFNDHRIRVVVYRSWVGGSDTWWRFLVTCPAIGEPPELSYELTPFLSLGAVPLETYIPTRTIYKNYLRTNYSNYYNYSPKMADNVSLIRSALDIELNFEGTFNVHAKQSPIVPIKLRNASEIETFNEDYNCVQSEVNWFQTSRLHLNGYYNADFFFFSLLSDNAPSFENPYDVSIVPLYFGRIDFGASTEAGIWTGWNGAVALFSGAVHEESVGELGDVGWVYMYGDLFNELDGNGVFPYNTPLTVKDYHVMYSNSLYYFKLPAGIEAISPLKQDFHVDSTIGNGLSDIIMKKDLFGEYYKSHVLAWNTPSHDIPPLQLEDTFDFGGGIESEKVGGRADKDAFHYGFNKEVYGGDIQASITTVVGQYGVYGALPNILLCSPMNFCYGDLVSVVHPSICGEGLDYSFNLFNAAYTPFTYPYWVDPYPCADVGVERVEVSPALPAPKPLEGEEYVFKLLVRYTGPNYKYVLEGRLHISPYNGVCSIEDKAFRSGGVSVLYYTPFCEHRGTEEYHTRPLEFWVKGDAGVVMHLFIINHKLFNGKRAPKEPLSKVVVELVKDDLQQERWLDDRTYNNTDVSVIASMEIDPETLSGIADTRDDENRMVYACDIVFGGGEAVSMVTRRIEAEPGELYDVFVERVL